MGDRTEPTRARPVPFCFHNFLPEPATSTVCMSLPLCPPDYYMTAVWSRHRAFLHQDVIFGVHFDDLQVAHRHLGVAHVARPAHARKHPRRKTGTADRTGR